MTLDDADRRQQIERYGNAYSMLVEGLRKFPQEMWEYKPSPERWSIHELVVHIADSEANSYVRCRKLIAEPGSTIAAYDENGWARQLAYHEQSMDEALELFKWLRLKSYKLIRALPASVWEHTIEHPENGTMTFDDWLGIYERHIPEHLAQMQDNYEAWKRGDKA